MEKINLNISSVEKVAAFINFLKENKAVDSEAIELHGETRFVDCLIVATATSRRHAQGLADGINALCKEKDYDFLGMEGYEVGDWILIDSNDVIINIFRQETRDLYRLEDLWAKSEQKTRKEI